MLKLEPSRCVVVLYAIAFLLAVVGVVISALPSIYALLATLMALLLAVVGVRRHWYQQRGVLYFGDSGWAWQPDGGVLRPMELKKAVGWSDWILQLTLIPSGTGRYVANQLIILPDSSHRSQRRCLRAFLLSQKLQNH